jgi:hypothetical protein
MLQNSILLWLQLVAGWANRWRCNKVGTIALFDFWIATYAKTQISKDLKIKYLLIFQALLKELIDKVLKKNFQL